MTFHWQCFNCKNIVKDMDKHIQHCNTGGFLKLDGLNEYCSVEADSR